MKDPKQLQRPQMNQWAVQLAPSRHKEVERKAGGRGPAAPAGGGDAGTAR